MNVVCSRYQPAKLCIVFLLLCCLVMDPGSTITASAFSSSLDGKAASSIEMVNAATAGFYVSGRFLYDAAGVNFVMRGVNHAHTWYRDQTSSFANIKAKGANTVRVVLSSGDYVESSGYRWKKNSARDVANVISLCKTNKLICILEVHDTTGSGERAGATSLARAVQYWKSIQDKLTGQEAFVIINIGNEPNGHGLPETWLEDTKDAIVAMRDAGFQHMLMVDAPNWGQDRHSFMPIHAAEILDSDVNGNIVFSIHMYGEYETSEKVEDYILSFVDAGLPLVIGQFGHLHIDGDPDEDAIMHFAEQYGIGYLGWLWSGNSNYVKYLDMVTNFNPNKMTWWGKRIFYGEDGICLTSVEASIYGGDRNPIVCRTDPVDPNPTNASLVNFTVTFSESVTDVGIDDFALRKNGVTGGGIVAISGSGNTYNVTVNTGSGSGTIRLDVADDDSIKDDVSHPLGGVGTGNGNFRLGAVYTITRSAPPLISPARRSLVSSLQPTFQWKDSVPAFIRYHLQLSTNNTFSLLVIDESTIFSPSFIPSSDLTPGSEYYWRIRGFNSFGESSSWSTAWSFKTPLSQPVLVSPTEAESLTTDRPSFEWSAVDGAASYVLQVSAGSNFSTLLLDTTRNETEYSMTKDLPQNKTLFWRVRAKNTVVTGLWSLKGTFKTGNPPTVPVLAAPVNAALLKDYTPEFNWNNASLPVGTTFKYYEIQWDEDKDFTSPVTNTTTLNDRTDSDFTPLVDLASNTKYYWRVRSVNTVDAVDHTSGWSPIWSFRTILPAPTGLNVVPNGLKPTFEWDDAAAPFTGYTIQVSTTSKFSTLLVNSTIPSSFYTMSKNLPSGKTLHWRVRVNGPNGPSAWTTIQYMVP